MPQHIAVVGAGAFGGWTALTLLRAGHRVTLIDAWGPGHSRSSSGDESRVIRGGYGPNSIYTWMVAQSLPIWRENERRWGTKLLQLNSVLWTTGIPNDPWNAPSLDALREHSLPFYTLTPDEGRRQWPQMNWDGIEAAFVETDAGFIYARRSCQAVWQAFLAEGGSYLHSDIRPGSIHSGTMDGLRLTDGSTLVADQYVFAAGPWLPQLFPEILGPILTPTRQDIFYFGTPPGDSRFHEDHFPAWIDNTPPRMYGMPGNEFRGFKIAKDVPGIPIDPTTADRAPSPEARNEATAYIARRFPALAGAPVAEFRVCQYEMTADGGLIIDRHPAASNVIISGGGSGHSFKFCPMVGQLTANLVLRNEPTPPAFHLSRFSGVAPGQIGDRK